ncbi:unnamed protein product [Linum tenue]|uniref:TF-B3 domain-containing protein n=1 Tax=Linum tenue TaxID=586396 RepID=A0AAV0NIS3_9ROSI|nr:unnamed protein product [Linum tenue]
MTSFADSHGTRFFKIILQGTLRDKKLLIPERFVENCGEGLLDSAILKVPSGLSWTVDLVSDRIGVWFGNGWQDFAEFHSLKYGHFLIFEYKGCSSFYVVICDRTATEIVYPITRTASNPQPADKVLKLFPEPVVEVIENFCGGVDVPQRNKCKPPMEVSQPRGKKKKMKRGSATRNDNVKMVSCIEQSAAGHHSSAQGLGGNSMELGREEKESGDEIAPEESPLVEERMPLTAFTSPHPCFEARMTSHGLKRWELYVPRSFSVRHIGEDEKSVKLQIADKTWRVGLNSYPSEKALHLCKGWRVFTEENSLKPGDICIFECIQRWTNVLLKVTIIRES